jgi:broad specificity phosphatase PhoE
MSGAMNRLYLIRHGENPANLTKEFSCRDVDYSLTPKGELQARQTAEFFTGKDIHAIFTSPLKRSQETAGIIAGKLGLTPIIMENFREIDVGDLEGQPVTRELWECHDQVVASWLMGKPETRFPNGENYLEAWERMRVGVKQIFTGKQQYNVIVVGHGGLFTATIKELCPNMDFSLLLTRENHNCSISEIQIEVRDEDLYGELETWGSCTHLSGQAADLISGHPG